MINNSSPPLTAHATNDAYKQMRTLKFDFVTDSDDESIEDDDLAQAYKQRHNLKFGLVRSDKLNSLTNIIDILTDSDEESIDEIVRLSDSELITPTKVIKHSNHFIAKKTINKFGEITDPNAECLVFGFIRNINIINKIIPLNMILLCVTFYFTKPKIICVKDQQPKFIFFDTHRNEFYNVLVKSKSSKTTKQLVSSSGICVTPNFSGDDIPQSVFDIYDNLNKNKVYDILFQIGTGLGQKECNAYIIDEKKDINMYQWILPSCYTYRTCVVYSNRYGLIEIGGRNTTFNVLEFGEYDKYNDFDEWRWNKVDNLSVYRGYISAVMLNNDTLFCCGGYPLKYGNYSEIYDFNLHKWNRLSDMNFGRYRSGICINKYNKSIIYVCGGFRAQNKFEYYDATKDLWVLLSDTKKPHDFYPIIFMDNPNVVNVASTNSEVFERIDLRENKWTTSLNSDKFDNIFSYSLDDAADFRLCV